MTALRDDLPFSRARWPFLFEDQVISQHQLLGDTRFKDARYAAACATTLTRFDVRYIDPHPAHLTAFIEKSPFPKLVDGRDRTIER